MMDAETLVTPETLERLHSETSEAEVLVKLSVSDACHLARVLEPSQGLRGQRIRAALRNAMMTPQTPDGNRLFAVQIAVHTDADGNLTASRIIDAEEVTE